MIYMEHDGALYKGAALGLPSEIWSAKEGKWVPYADAGQQKPVEWGSKISAEEAREIMDEERAHIAARAKRAAA